MMTKEDIDNTIYEMTGHMFGSSELADILETGHRNFVFNHIHLEEDSHATRDEATSFIVALETMIDALRGKFYR